MPRRLLRKAPPSRPSAVTRRALTLLAVAFLVALRGCADGEAPDRSEATSKRTDDGSGSTASHGDSPRPPDVTKVRIGGRTFHLEVARTESERRRGLMGRSSLPEDRGMLFVFPASRRRSFWMKDCEIPLDVIFLDDRGRVINIHEMEPPDEGTPTEELEHYRSASPARFAVELRKGMAEKLGLSRGEKVLDDPERIGRWAR